MSGMNEVLKRLERAVQSFGPPSAAEPGTRDLLAQALCEIALQHGLRISPVSLVAGLPLVDGLLPLEHVASAASRAGLVADVAAGKVLALADVELPVIMMRRDSGVNIVWAIERDTRGQPIAAITSQPGQSSGQSRISAKDLAAASAGRIIRLRPLSGQDARADDASKPKQSNWFLKAFSASNWIYSEAIAATIAINLLALALPLFTMNVYDRVLPNLASETLWSLAIGVTLATAFDFLIKLLRGHFVDTAGRRADVLLSNMIFSRLIGAKLDGPAASAGVRANTMRELDTLREFYNSATITVLGDMPFMFLFIAVIAVVAGGLVLIPLIAIPIVLAIGWVTQRAMGRMIESSIRQMAVKNAVVVETVSGLESLKAAGAESWAAAQWEKATAESIRTGNQIKHYSNFGIFSVHAVQTLTQVIMIIAGFYMAAAGNLTMGAIIAATMLAGRAMQPLAQAAHLVARLYQTRTSYRLLSEIVNAPQERPDSTSFISMRKVTGAISFEGASFQYDKDAARVIDDVSFSIAAGEHVGLIGGIGTGKSTALKLIHSLREPQAGRVLLDGIPVSQFDPAELRSHVGLVLQQADLFHGTIRANITMGDPSIAEAALIEAARVSGALDWIMTLPKGFDSEVRERGAGLSGGQRQTIVLARTIVRRPRVVLLDEPTSDLDPHTEQIVVERLRGWLKGRTALIVTHRPAMLALVDRLIVLEGGRKRLDGPKPAVLATLAAASRLPAQVKTVEAATL